MKSLIELAARAQDYENRHAAWVSLGNALHSEHEAIIADSYAIAEQLRSELPAVPAYRSSEIQADPPKPEPATQENNDTLSSILAEAFLKAERDKKPCADMSDEELCIGFVDIVKRCAQPQGIDFEWLLDRHKEFLEHIEASGIAVAEWGAMAFRLSIPGNDKPYAIGTPEAQEWTDGWLGEQARSAKIAALIETEKAA